MFTRLTPRMTVRRHHAVRLSFAALLAGAPAAARADWRDDIGFTRLGQTYASGVPTAVSAGVAQIEAGDTAGNSYLPDSANAAFSGKTITNKSAGSGSSDHATTVGAYFYGNTNSLVPATTQIDAYNASGWAALIPYAETRRVQNHSWIGTAFSEGADIDAAVAAYGLRLDYMAQTYGTVVVVGVNNGQSTTLPYLLCQGYNQISVGLTNGQHSAGYTAYDGAGRIKPDLVAPDSVTSFATPQVASAAGLLAEKLAASPYSLSGANLPRVVKALLLTGATKDEFAAWSRTDVRPIDTRHGAGELNILLAYRTLLAGPVSASGSATVADTAWASATVRSSTAANSRTYFFDVPADASASRFAATLIWHRAITTTGGALSGSLANLDLALHSVEPGSFTVGAALQTSASTVDNLEHIHVPDLPAGRYALRLSSDSSAQTPYALAWRTLPTVTVAATDPAAAERDGSPAVFTVSRAGPTTSPLLVPLAWGGTAVSGTHYKTPPESVLIPAGSASTTVAITPVADDLAQGARTVTLTVASDFSLSAGAAASASAVIEDKPYDAWRFARFTAEQLADADVSGPDADPDADGLANLLEYALGAEPLSADASARAPAAGVDADHLTLAYHAPSGRSDITYVAEWSTDLVAWQSGTGIAEELSRIAGEGGDNVIVRAVASLSTQPRQFLRLRVSRE